VDATLDENTEAPAGDDGESEGGGLNAKKIILFIVLPLFTLLGAGGGLYFTGALDKFLKKEPTEEHAAAPEAHGDDHGKSDGHSGPPKTVFFLEIPDISVNLADTGSKPSYLRLKVQLELANQGDLAAVEAVMPRVVDQFQTYLRELRVRDLRGSAGIYRLQMELLTRVNSAVAPVEVKDVLFQEILIQ
jgi:flagellar FliL protein